MNDQHRGFHSGKYNLPELGGSPKKRTLSTRLQKLGNRVGIADRLIRERNINPELNKLASKIKPFKKAIRKGKLSFQAEIKGFNSDRHYLGFKYKF